VDVGVVSNDRLGTNGLENSSGPSRGQRNLDLTSRQVLFAALRLRSPRDTEKLP